MKNVKTSTVWWLAAILATVMALAACGSDTDTATDDQSTETAEDSADGDSGDGGDTEDGETADDLDGESDPAAATASEDEAASADGPSSIVSLSPTATEILFAIGADEQVSAVDMFSNHPAEAPEGTIDALVPDLELILASEPDLVVTTFLPEDITAGLEAADVPILIQPAATNLDDVYAQIAELGEITGQIDGAAQTNAELRASVDEILAGLPERDTPLTVFHEIDESFYTATSATFIGDIYDRMGFDNIADEYDDGSGYPLIDGEAVIAADPDVIVYTSQAPYDAETIADRPGWDAISAVANGRIVEVDADIASRWGPRIDEFMQSLADAVDS